MTYSLILGDYAYSSWSLRGWLLFERFGIPFSTVMLDFHAEASVAEQMPELAPAKTVPAVRMPEGAVVSDSLAMAEELATRHPEAGIWPRDPFARATARTLASEMHSGFMALRGDCPMNLRTAYSDSQPSEAVKADLTRLEVIWAHARANIASDTPWLCGEYSAADAFFAPVAARIAGYNLPVSAEARAYVDAHLADPAFQKWRAMGLAGGKTLPWYAKGYPTTNWPDPT
jgi:glutathione S-transferase